MGDWLDASQLGVEVAAWLSIAPSLNRIHLTVASTIGWPFRVARLLGSGSSCSRDVEGEATGMRRAHLDPFTVAFDKVKISQLSRQLLLVEGQIGGSMVTRRILFLFPTPLVILLYFWRRLVANRLIHFGEA